VKLNFLFKEIKMFKVPKKIKYNKGKYTLSFLLLVYHFLLGKVNLLKGCRVRTILIQKFMVYIYPINESSWQCL